MIGAVGIEIWTMQSGIHFSNVLVDSSLAVAQVPLSPRLSEMLRSPIRTLLNSTLSDSDSPLLLV